jgi:hypothetical protein
LTFFATKNTPSPQQNFVNITLLFYYTKTNLKSETNYITVGTVCIINAKSITNKDFAAIFTVEKQNFRLFSFCILNFAQFAIRNKKKSSKKFCFRGEKLSLKKLIFFSSPIFTAVFFGGGQFSPNLKPYSDRSLSTQHRFQKSGGGVMGRLF